MNAFSLSHLTFSIGAGHDTPLKNRSTKTLYTHGGGVREGGSKGRALKAGKHKRRVSPAVQEQMKKLEK